MATVYNQYEIVTASFTRPNNTTAYSVNDVISGTASTGTAMTFPNCANDNGGSFMIKDVRIWSSAYAATAATLELLLLSTNPTSAINDNLGVGIADSESQNILAVIPLSAQYAASASIGTGGSMLWQTDAADRVMVCAATSTTLYGVLKASSAYNTIANEQFRVSLHIVRDLYK